MGVYPLHSLNYGVVTTSPTLSSATNACSGLSPASTYNDRFATDRDSTTIKQLTRSKAAILHSNSPKGGDESSHSFHRQTRRLVRNFDSL